MLISQVPTSPKRCETSEIRVYWRDDVEHHEDDQHHDHGIWMAATEANSREAITICQIQNARYGVNSHWVEERCLRAK